MHDQILSEAVRSLARVFHERQVQHALIGDLAVGVRGRPRSTKDADFLIKVSAHSLPGLFEELRTDGFDLDLIPTIQRWSADKLIVFHRGSARIDWLQPVLPVYQTVLDTAVPATWHDQVIHVATAEGLILTKLVSYRMQDQADIVTLLAANRDTINLSWIHKEWSVFASSEPERTRWLEDVIHKYTT